MTLLTLTYSLKINYRRVRKYWRRIEGTQNLPLTLLLRSRCSDESWFDSRTVFVLLHQLQKLHDLLYAFNSGCIFDVHIEVASRHFPVHAAHSMEHEILGWCWT